MRTGCERCRLLKRIRQIADEAAALNAAGVMIQGTVLELTSSLSLDAARLSLDSGLAMADAIILASARLQGAVLWDDFATW